MHFCVLPRGSPDSRRASILAAGAPARRAASCWRARENANGACDNVVIEHGTEAQTMRHISWRWLTRSVLAMPPVPRRFRWGGLWTRRQRVLAVLSRWVNHESVPNAAAVSFMVLCLGVPIPVAALNSAAARTTLQRRHAPGGTTGMGSAVRSGNLPPGAERAALALAVQRTQAERGAKDILEFSNLLNVNPGHHSRRRRAPGGPSGIQNSGDQALTVASRVLTTDTRGHVAGRAVGHPRRIGHVDSWPGAPSGPAPGPHSADRPRRRSPPRRRAQR